MIGSLRLLVSPSSTVALSLALLIVAIILFVGNVTIASAQQPPLTSQPVMTQNRVELFQSTEDGIRLSVPQGWLIQDLNNTGPVFSEESTRGYGILAQLCRGEEQQQQQQRQQGQEGAAPVNANNTYGCQIAQEEVVHIVRYPNLDTGIQAANNSTSTTASAPPASGASFNNNNQTITTLPAKFVEMTYTTTASSAPNETKRGYFLLTATNATAPDLGVTKGYSVFYEGNYISAETRSSNSSAAPTPLPEALRQVFGSFELVTAAAAAATQIEPPTVEIIASDTEDTAPATFEFEAEITGGMEPYSYSWDFGDGSEEEDDDEDVEHTFDEAGSYSVSLTVTDSRGQSASDSIGITVEEPPPLTSVEIIASDTEDTAPATFEFEAEITGGMEPYSYSWDFGDGSEEEDDDEDEDVEHTFDEAGSYSVSLSVTDSRGQSASDSIEITVEEPPVVEEEQPTAEEEEGNDSVDVEGAVDDFIDDLFGRLGLR